MGLMLFGKIVLTILNTVFAMVSVIMIVMGCLVFYAGDWLVSVLDPILAELRLNGFPDASLQQDGINIYELVHSVAIPIIVCGVILFVISFAGCIGANCENRLFLAIYAISMGVILGAEVLAIIVLAGGQAEWKSRMINTCNDHIIEQYQGDNGTDAVSVVTNTVFLKAECCSVKGYKPTQADEKTKTWKKTKQFKKNKARYTIKHKNAEAPGPIEIPFSCCKQDKSFPKLSPKDLNCGKTPTPTNTNIEKPCWEKVEEWVVSYDVYAILFTCGMLLVQIGILALTIIMCVKIGKSGVSPLG